MLNDKIPPGGEVANSVGVKRRKIFAKLFLSLGVKASIGQVRQEELTIHVNGANGMVNEDTMGRTRSRPRKDRSSVGINDHVGGIMNVALEVLPDSTLPKRRESRTSTKQGRETQRIGEASALMRVPGRI
jgi:hypothetical protein